MDTIPMLGGMETGVQIARPGTVSTVRPATLEVYKALAMEHGRYEARLKVLLSKPFPTEAEKLEELHLKKLKLRLKDRMATLYLKA